MTTPPPPGWYPDPEAAGRQWRWWDGARWAPPGYGYAPAYDATAAHAHALEQHAASTRSTGRWLRWGMVATAVSSVLGFALFAATLHDVRVNLGSTDLLMSDTGGRAALRIAALPFQIGSLAFIVLLIGWIWNAGKFAEQQRWPAMRGRTLGAFSVIIPIVNFWWPYEAIRDCYPPGQHPRVLLQWWLAHIALTPIVGIAVFVSAAGGATAVSWMLVGGGAIVATLTVVLGFRVIGDLDAMQRAHLAPAA